MKNLIVTFVFAFIHQFSFAQLERDIFQDIDRLLADKIDIRPLPDNGDFITIQIGVVRHETAVLGYDEEMLSKLTLIRPVYYKVEGSKIHLSVGLFNSSKNTRATERELDKIFMGSFIVPYSNGSRITFDSFRAGNLEEEIKPDFNAIRKDLKKMLKKNYYKIQIGFYTVTGYEKSEQKKIDLLTENGYKLTEEKTDKGRFLVTKNKYKTWEEVQNAKKMISDLIQSHCLVKRYYKYNDLKYYHIDYLTEMYLALTT